MKTKILSLIFAMLALAVHAEQELAPGQHWRHKDRDPFVPENYDCKILAIQDGFVQWNYSVGFNRDTTEEWFRQFFTIPLTNDPVITVTACGGSTFITTNTAQPSKSKMDEGNEPCDITPPEWMSNGVLKEWIGHRSELITNWVTLWTEGSTNHECGVVTSNYFAQLVWKGKTNRVDLESQKLVLDKPPQREETNSFANGIIVITNWITMPFPLQPNWPNNNHYALP